MPLLELLYSALHSPYGIIVASRDPEKLRQKLYPIRKERPELTSLSFIISPLNPGEDLWIVKVPDDGK